MRRIGGFFVLAAALADPAVANDIYTWRDPQGIPHYSNAPVPGARAVDLYDGAVAPSVADDGPPPAVAAAEPAPDGTAQPTAVALSDDERSAYATGAALRRQALERSYRSALHRRQELERSLTELAGFRVRHANDGARGEGFESDEEKQLAEEKAGVERELDETRREYAALQGEVTTRLGGMPDWWIALPN